MPEEIYTNDLASTRLRDVFTSISHARIRIIVCASIYFVAFAWIYVLYVADAFWDLGFGFASNWSDAEAVLVGLIAIAPSIWLPTRFERPSAVFIYFQYFLIYVPAVWMTRHSFLPALNAADQTVLCIALPMSLGILLWAHYQLPLLRVNKFRVEERLIWLFIYAICGSLVILLIAGLGGNFRIVSLDEIYTLRESADDLISASGSKLLRYAFPWVNGLLLPMIYGRAANRRNYLMISAVFACYVFLFGIWGSKTSLSDPLLLLAASAWVSRGAAKMPVLLVAALVGALILPALLPFENGIGNLIKLGWIAVVDMRTFSIPGMAIVQYYDFFSSHPWTLGSQVTGLNWLIDYQYDYNIPQTVGYYYYGTLVTANANFWAQDGLASFGIIGMGVTSMVAALVFWILDSVTRGMDMKFLIPALVGIMVAFANVSIFTTLVTGGLGFFILACLFMPRANSDSASFTK
jgi:hypothetical protein